MVEDPLPQEVPERSPVEKSVRDVTTPRALSVLLDPLLEALLAATGADMADVRVLDAPSGDLQIEAHRGLDKAFVEFFHRTPVAQGASGQAVQRREYVVVEDVVESAAYAGRAVLEAMLEARIRAVQAVPLVNESGVVLGALSAYYHQARRPSEHDLHMLGLLARQAASLVEKAGVEWALRASELRHRMLMDLMPAAVYTCEAPSGIIQYYNRRAAELWGREPAPGDTDQRFCGSFRLYRPDGTALPHDQTPMAQVLRGAPPVRNEQVQIERPDGSRIVVEVNIDPLSDKSGRRIGAINVFQDLTERRRQEEDRALLAAIVDSSDDAIVSKSLDGTIRSWNAGAQRLFGYRPEEVIGKPITIIIPPERHEEERTLLRRIRRGERLQHFETVRVSKDGRRMDISLTISPVRNVAGRIIGASKVGRDITARKRSEEALQRSENILLKRNERMQLLSEAAGHLLAAVDPDAMVRGLFERIKAHLGIDLYLNYVVSETGDTLRLASHAGISGEAAAANARISFGQGISGAVAQSMQPVTATHIQSSNDLELGIAKSFGVRACSCHPLQAGERLLGTLWLGSRTRDEFDADEIELMRTVCHYVAVAYERVRLIEELRAADRRKDEFLAMLGHELRNPLAAILTGATLLQSDPPKDRRVWVEQAIARQAHQMRRLVDDLLEVSRITRGKIALQKEPVDLATIVSDAVEISRPLIEARNHQLSIALPSEPMRLEADPVRLTQVIANLLNNAAKYMADGGHIWINGRWEGPSAVLSVRDSGIGIAQDMLPHVFELFTQTEKSPGPDGGLGVGLALARSLVTMHGGEIEARSAGVDQGSEFVVRLPAPGEVRPAIQGSPSQPAIAKPAAARRRILIVDDNVDAAESIGLLLQQMGHEVQIAQDGLAGIEQARANLPEVVLLDLGMPGLDGYEVARRLRRELDAAGPMLIIAITGYSQDEHRRRTASAGFDAHLVKPVTIEALQSLLQPPQAASALEAL